MDLIPTYTTFGLYLVFMVVVGLYFYRKETNIKEYLLGGRGMGSWVTAMSAQASDMSGWLLMGLPGAVYCAGLGESWVAIGLVAGTLANWVLIAPRLRIYTEKARALTISAYLGRRFRDPTGIIRILAAAITLFFFTIYAASGLVAAGKLFESMFAVDFKIAVLVGAVVILLYVFMGGYLAVCWTDLFQGLLMFFALIAVPAAAAWNLESGAVAAACEAKNVSFSLIPKGGGMAAAVAIISSAVWGLGYFGQPHILTRFMSIHSFRALPRATTIAMIWVVISLGASILIGILAIPMWSGAAELSKADSEKVFIYMIGELFNPWIGGILLAAILAAIMSTIDSQLLVSSSTLTEDFYKLIIKRKASTREQVAVSRGFVLLITVVATVFALADIETIFSLVKFAWGGFGAAFGPVILMSLYSRRMTWQAALCGMIAGMGVMLGWYAAGLSRYMYEILPGFAAGLATILFLNHTLPQRDPKVLREFDSMTAELRSGTR